MAERRLTSAAPWVRVLAVYAIARAVTTLLMALSSALAPADGRHGQGPSILDYIAGWDAAWYREIALNGYPADLPVDDSGSVQQNAWAFMPIFPWLARGLAAVWPAAGLGSGDVWAIANAWAIAAALVSLVAGFFACWAVYVLLERALDAERALWGTAFVAAGPLALMFQVGYAEALFLAVAMWALVALSREAWWWLYPASMLLAFVRPGELALPLTIALYGIWRILNRRDRPIERREVVHILGTGAVGTLAGFAWPVIVNAVTGSGSAYFDTELAWRAGWVPGGADGFVPGEGWLTGASVWADLWGIPTWAGYVLLAVIAAAAVLLFLTPAVRALGIETRLWSASYLVYAALVLFPQSSTFRLLLPIAPLIAGALAFPKLLRSSRILILIALAALQFWWIHAMYGHGNTYFLIP
ncbi:MAG: hypothetical protein ACTMIH_02020 [Microbacterium gubbeenense]|uniref:hypothetical protein n=1 Tax=Microbacterium gubbeenense TaxID=159896 RepID=UPI0004922234|nr:hypothetical protein [Microbacterium gubbeenense]